MVLLAFMHADDDANDDADDDAGDDGDDELLNFQIMKNRSLVRGLCIWSSPSSPFSCKALWDKGLRDLSTSLPSREVGGNSE